MIRYAFYAAKDLGSIPYALSWLRYTTFIVLYPLGVASELALVALALPSIKQRQLLAYPMPNVVNMSFSYAALCRIIMACYLPGALHMSKEGLVVVHVGWLHPWVSA